MLNVERYLVGMQFEKHCFRLIIQFNAFQSETESRSPKYKLILYAHKIRYTKSVYAMAMVAFLNMYSFYKFTILCLFSRLFKRINNRQLNVRNIFFGQFIHPEYRIWWVLIMDRWFSFMLLHIFSKYALSVSQESK